MAGDFECAMRLFFGEKAYHLEDAWFIPKQRNQWLRRAFKRIAKDFNELDSSPEHRHLLLLEAQGLGDGLPRIENVAPTWGLVYRLLRIIG